MDARAIIEHCTPALRRYARALTGRDLRAREIADDLVHESILDGLRHCGRFQAEARAGDHNAAVGLRVRLYKMLTHLHRQRWIAASPFCDERVDAAGRRAFERLPLAEREALALVVIEGFSYTQACEILGLTRQEIIALLARARKSAIEETAPVRAPYLRLVK